MQLPQSFIENTEALMGRERFERYLQSFEEEPPVSIRLNPHNTKEFNLTNAAQSVPWCEYGVYLDHRPNFTFDPLLHAGCYYVQEAASMFIHHIVSSLFYPLSLDSRIRKSEFAIHNPTPPLTVLDACAAPGGKSTLLRAVLPESCVLFSNEPIRNRASILLENVQKWGWPNHIVTCNYPRDYRKAGLMFDLILSDVPCSGEGMFRRDPATIGEWSPQNVERCSRLQREIITDLWPCLRPGGLLIYSTCTFNIKENEENIRWMQDELEAEVVPIPTLPEWHITDSLLPGFDAPVYRFIPGITRSEGLFVCVLRKAPATDRESNLSHPDRLNILSPITPSTHNNRADHKNKQAESGKQKTSQKTDMTTPHVDLPYQTAIAYLRREAIVLPPDTPRGLVSVTFRGHHLGYVKNIGSRANNLYPKEWAIKSTHIPNEYTPVIL